MSSISHESILSDGYQSAISPEMVDLHIVHRMYRFMLRLRRSQEEIIGRYHPDDNMRCPVHFSIGQEAIPAALTEFMHDDDYVFCHHRSHGHYLAKGGDMRGLLAELHGRETGVSGGLAGSQELAAPGINFYSGAVITGMLATAVGAALGFQLRESSSIAIAICGDGAADEGLFWEAMSYAVLRDLPVLFVCENNRYSTYSPQDKRQASDDVCKRVQAFGMDSKAIFGNDVLANYVHFSDALRHVRNGEGPFFLEAYTYRWFGHVGPEDDDYNNYRSEKEVEFWKSYCPLEFLEKQLFATGLLTAHDKSKILEEINQEIDDAFRFAEASSFPAVKSFEEMNWRHDTPVADRLLVEKADSSIFDQKQEETLPKPY